MRARMETVVIGIGNPVLSDDSVGRKWCAALPGGSREFTESKRGNCTPVACG